MLARLARAVARLLEPDPMTVTEAVERRISVRAVRPDPVSGDVVREILQIASRAPSGGNLQPWRVHALSGEPLAELKTLAAAKMAAGGEAPEYDVYPANLRELANNLNFFGAPVGLFFSLERRLGPPQWSDVGMYMQTVMLLAVERGLDTCPQEFWARLPKTAGDFIGLPEDHMLFSGMALGYRDEAAPINGWRTRRDDFEVFAEMRGF